MKDAEEQERPWAATQVPGSPVDEKRSTQEELRAARNSLEARTEELAYSLAMMGATLDSTADGILATDANGHVTGFNDQFLRMWQVSREQAAADEPGAMQRRAAEKTGDPQAFLARLAEIYQRWPEETFDVLELVDGRVFERVSKIQRVGQRSAGRVWSFRDVTKRRAADLKLREQREWFEVTLSSIGDAVITTDVEGRVTFMNAVAEAMTGWAVPEAKGRRLVEVFRIVSEETGEPAPEPVSRVLETGAVIGMANHTALVDRRGVVRAIEDSAAPIRDPAGKITGVVIVFHDVTERRRADEARLRLAAVVESSDDAIVTKTLDGVISSWNEGAARMFGYTAEETIGRPVTMLMPPDYVNEEPGILERLRRGERIDHYETVRRRKDGTLLDISLTVSPIRDGDGRIIGASKIARDITERKRAQAALQKSAEEFRQLADSMPQIVWTARPDGTVDYFNRRWYEYAGREAATGGDVGWRAVLHPDDQRRCAALWDESVRTGEPYQIEYRFRNRAGEYRWHLGRALPVRDEAGAVVRWYGSATDIHEQRLTAEALREEYAIVEQLNAVSRALATELELEKIVQIITDAGTRITRAQWGAFFYNRAEERSEGEDDTLFAVSGVTRSTFERHPLFAAREVFGRAFRGEGVVRIADVSADERFRGGQLHRAPSDVPPPVASCLAVPVKSRSGEAAGALLFGHEQPGVFTERDERIMAAIAAQAAAAMDTARLYEAEQHARNAAEQANLAKDHFLAALSHELRTPLTPVLAILTSLTEDATVPPAIAKDLRTMRRNVELEARLIDDLLDLTRITRGKLELHCEAVELGALLENALATCQPDINAKQLELVRDLANAREVMRVDEARITQVLWNLLKNAVKFTPEGGTITVRSRVMSGPEGRTACIEIQDTGIGIEPDRIGRIFEAFEQGDRTVTQQFGGLGLGLAISKAIAELHAGSVRALSSGHGHGSTFTLRLPCEACEETPGRDTHEPATAKSAGAAVADVESKRRVRLLLVEDHADTAAVLARMLGRSGYEVLHASSVGEALTVAERAMAAGGLQLVISDLGLPDGSGLDMMRVLAGRHGLRGIALSGYGMEGDREQSAAAGFARHLTKPVNVNVLRSTIAVLVVEMGA